MKIFVVYRLVLGALVLDPRRSRRDLDTPGRLMRGERAPLLALLALPEPAAAPARDRRARDPRERGLDRARREAAAQPAHAQLTGHDLRRQHLLGLRSLRDVDALSASSATTT